MWSGLGMCGEIHEAVKNNDNVRIRDLIKGNPDLTSARDEDGFSPLHLAAANGHKGVVEFLLMNKADVKAKDNAGSTPLHQAAAAEGQRTDLVEILLAHDADVNAADKRGLTPLHYATLANNLEVIKSLLAHGANINAKDNKAGHTPLILAVAKGDRGMVEALLANGADVNAADCEGTPLAWARHKGHREIADLLGQHGGHE
jgi:ankyrin repeat protein